MFPFKIVMFPRHCTEDDYRIHATWTSTRLKESPGQISRLFTSSCQTSKLSSLRLPYDDKITTNILLSQFTRAHLGTYLPLMAFACLQLFISYRPFYQFLQTYIKAILPVNVLSIQTNMSCENEEETNKSRSVNKLFFYVRETKSKHSSQCGVMPGYKRTRNGREHALMDSIDWAKILNLWKELLPRLFSPLLATDLLWHLELFSAYKLHTLIQTDW